MRSVERIDKPKILAEKESLWLENYNEALLKYTTDNSSTNKKAKEKAEKKYNHSQIKKTLVKMFFGKCAYCESFILHTEYGNIEHFRPKSKYPEKCFDWNNLLLSCNICNGKKYKGDNFPIISEEPLIIDPTKENPNNYLCFEFDLATGTANVLPQNIKGETSIEILGLNRPSLVMHRSKKVRDMIYCTLQANEGNKEQKEKLLEYCSEENEYSAFAIALCKKFNIY
jgi:uncharacterized protein (TIGR02646 family)